MLPPCHPRGPPLTGSHVMLLNVTHYGMTAGDAAMLLRALKEGDVDVCVGGG